MDSAEQANGEKRVRQVLIEPLMRRGLAKPTSLTKVQFEAMLADLCARLAYMSETSLMALEEQVASNPGGKDRDRLPIANRILDWAGHIQPPGDDASPLVRAVFADQVGAAALAGGYAPELVQQIKKPPRLWPTHFVIKGVRERAEGAVRQMQRMDECLARGESLSPTEADWRARRLDATAKLQRIADMARQTGGGSC